MKEPQLLSLAAELARQSAAFNTVLAETLQSLADGDEPAKVEPEKVEPEKVEPEKVEPEKVEPEKVELVEPEKVEPVEPAKRKRKAVKAVKDEPKGEPKGEPKDELTADAMRKECMRLVREDSSLRPAIVEVLARFGAETVKDLKAEDYTAVMEELKALESAADII